MVVTGTGTTNSKKANKNPVVDDELRGEVRSYYGEDSVHGWEHALRVEGLAARIAEDEPGADEGVVGLGAVLHDIGRKKEKEGEIQDHAVWGGKETRRLLTRYGYDEVIDEVTHCVEAHRYSTEPEPRTTEACVVADADDLDAVGAVGIARAFSHGEGFDTTVEHIYGKLLSLGGRMRTSTGREIARDRHSFLEEFIEKFENERRGKDA